MNSRAALYSLALILFLVGIGLTLYKHFALGFPLLPNDERSVWTVEANIEFEATGDPVIVSLGLPDAPPGVEILEEDFASPDYGFSYIQAEHGPRAQWSKRVADGQQSVFYRMEVYKNRSVSGGTGAASTAPLVLPEFDDLYATAANTLLTEARERSANDQTLTLELIKSLSGDNLSQNSQLLLDLENSSYSRAELLIDLLAIEGIRARLVRGLLLEDERRRQLLSEYIEVFTNDQWLFINQLNGEVGIPENLLLWQRGGQSLLEVTGGRRSRVSFSIIKNTQSTGSLAVRYGKNTNAALVDFSIYSLPIEEQNAFKSILLIPIGALIVVFMRIIVGVRTSGTFMPILIALAFIQTTLLTGLIIFLLVISIGLLIRAMLSRLNLLLVARISAVIIVVVGIISMMSIVSNKLGLSQTISVTLFPMIILAWTIERMSVLWEEDGPHEVMIQGAGSLVVAVLAYLAMTNSVIEHLTFNFPELLFVILALILLLGQYTGYRLSELRRFRALLSADDQPD